MPARPGDFAAAPPNVVPHLRQRKRCDHAVFLNIHAPSSRLRRRPARAGARRASTSTTRRRTEGDPFRRRRLHPPRRRRDPIEHRGEHSTGILCDRRSCAIDMTFRPEFEGVRRYRHTTMTTPTASTSSMGQIEFLVGDETARRRRRNLRRRSTPSRATGSAWPATRLSVFLNLHAPPGGFVDRLRAND